MNPAHAAAASWGPEEVLARLRAQTRPGGRARLHVFLTSAVAAECTEQAARRITDLAVAETGTSAAEIGPVRRSARSFLVGSELPAMEGIARWREVSAVLLTVIEAVYPTPVARCPRIG